MKKTTNTNTFKRVAAGALSVLTVAAYSMPANVGGFLTGGSALVAYGAPDEDGNNLFANLEVGEELTLEGDGITDEDEQKWTVTVQSGTILENNKPNTVAKQITNVTTITEAGINYMDGNTAKTVKFVGADLRDHADDNCGGSGIYVAAVDAEKYTLTLTWEDPNPTEGLSSDLSDDGLWNAITEILIDGVNYHTPKSNRILDDLCTGDVIVIKSKEALDITNSVKDLKYTCSYTADDAAAAKYTYTVTVGRHDIDVAIRTTTGQYVVADYVEGDAAPEDLAIFEGEDEIAADAGLYTIAPDKEYVIKTAADNLTLFVDADGDNALNVTKDKQINYTKATVVDEETNAVTGYTYTFTAPYNNIFVTRSLPHTHEWKWTANETKLTATCNKNGEENAHATSVANYYGIKLNGNAGGKVVLFGSDYDFTFESLENGTAEADADAALFDAFDEIVIRYIVKGELVEEKPAQIGDYKVVADLYIADEDGLYSTDEPGEFRFIKDFTITPATEELTVEVDGDYDYVGGIPKAQDIDWADDNQAWLAPDVVVSNNGTPLTAKQYVLEGALTATKKGNHTLIVVGQGEYAGCYGELVWYAPDDTYDYVIDGAYGYTYGDPINFSLNGYEGDQSKVVYKAESVYDKMRYEWWSGLTDEAKAEWIADYEEDEIDFTEPTEPEIITVGKDAILDVTTDNSYYVYAYNEKGEQIAQSTFGVYPRWADVELNKDSIVYDGKDHAGEFNLVAEGLLEKDTEIAQAIEAIEWKTEPESIVNAGHYHFIIDSDTIEDVLGDNYFYYDNWGENSFCFDVTPLSLVGFAEASASETYFVANDKYQKPTITVTAGEDTLKAGTDYRLAGTVSAKEAGDYQTRIIGTGNYKGVLTVDWTVLGQADFEEAITLENEAPSAMIVSGKEAIKFKFNRTKTDKSAGYEVAEAGYVYSNVAGNNTKELTLENVDGTNVKKSISKSTDYDGSYTLRIVDKGNGVSAAGYVTLRNIETGKTFTVYSEKLSNGYEYLVNAQMGEAIELEYVLPPTAYVVSGKNAVEVKFSREMAENAEEGLKVAEYGFIYSNAAAPDPEEFAEEDLYIDALAKWNDLSYEGVDGDVIKIKSVTSASSNDGTYKLKVVDKGDGIRYRAFVKLQNADGATFVKEIDVMEADFAELSKAQADSLVTVNDVVVNDNVVGNGYTAAKFKTTRALGEGIAAGDVTVLEYGFVYDNTGADIADDKFDVKNEGLKKNSKTGDSLDAAGSYSLTIKYKDENAIRVRGFVKVKDNKTQIESYVYGDIVTAGGQLL